MQRPLRRWKESFAMFAAMACVVSFNGQAQAQYSAPSRPAHFLVNGDMPPGALGQIGLMQRSPLQGYYQPVRIHAPQGAQIALAANGTFMPAESQPYAAGLMVGAVYRFQVTNIPNQPGVELFPTIEVIDRIYPPPGQEVAFPIPVHLDADDLAQALDGRLVTRVIYLEDPQTALPLADAPQSQRSIDVRSDSDPLHEADRLGRPVAVLRIGSRIPPSDPQQLDQFLLGSAPWLQIPRMPAETSELTVDGVPSVLTP